MRIFKILIALFIALLSTHSNAQNFSDSWEGHFSYLDVKDISQGTTKIYVAAESAIFTYDIESREIEKLSTIHGLLGETLSSIKYLEEEGILLIGYVSGMMQVYIESSAEFITVVDIFDKPTIPPNDKVINHFYIYNGFAYISTDYGISLYDIEALEFGDTYFIGPAGSQIKINQTTVFEDYLYTASPTGVKKGLVTNPNLIDFAQWEDVSLLNINGIVTVGNTLFAGSENNIMYDFSNGIPVALVTLPDPPLDIRSANNSLVVTTSANVFSYSENFTAIQSISASDYNDPLFTAATVHPNNELYVGTNGIIGIGKSGLGILKISGSDTSIYEEVHPESPLLNKFFKVNTKAGEIWGVHGGHSVTYNLSGGNRRMGISHFKEEEWRNISYDSIESTVFRPWYLSYIAIDPFNANQVYISSYFSGVLDITEGEDIGIFNQTNSTIVPFFSVFHITTALHFDSDGVLWATNGRVDDALNKFENGQWSSFSLSDVINPPNSNLGFSDIATDSNGNVFMSTLNYGLIGFNENNGNPLLNNVSQVLENVPSVKVWCVEVDKQDQIWFGTDAGLRVIYDADAFINGAPQVENIVVLDDGIPRELLFQQYVTDIEVDGSNNKWIATLDAGLYYFSADGQETIFHFTKDNSPLPSNDVLDVALDDLNGVVYVATEKGLVSFKSDTSKPEDSLENAYVFPNPVRPSFDITQTKVKIKGLTDNVNIKITDIEGNLVTEAESRTNSKFKGYNLEVDGGTALWNGKNLANRIVASGVYLILLSDLDSLETKVLKVMIVR